MCQISIDVTLRTEGWRDEERTLVTLLRRTLGNTVLGPKQTKRAEVRPRPKEQLDTREPSRLQSSLYRILRSKVREDEGEQEGGGGEQRQRRERDGRARACTMEERKFEPMHREAHLRQCNGNAVRSCPADSFTTPKGRR